MHFLQLHSFPNITEQDSFGDTPQALLVRLSLIVIRVTSYIPRITV